MAPREVCLTELDRQSGPGRGAAIFAAVVRDPHFWVPVMVLIAGLVLLRWVS